MVMLVLQSNGLLAVSLDATQPQPHQQIVQRRASTRSFRQIACLVRLFERVPQSLVLAAVEANVRLDRKSVV